MTDMHDDDMSREEFERLFAQGRPVALNVQLRREDVRWTIMRGAPDTRGTHNPHIQTLRSVTPRVQSSPAGASALTNR